MEVVVRAPRRAVVLDAADESCQTMVDEGRVEHVCYLATDASHPRLDQHRRAGYPDKTQPLPDDVVPWGRTEHNAAPEDSPGAAVR